ncbi:MAG: helix-turn-helix domain-containing protein [Smithella sp.]|jgi:Nif-specific regulatory protein
MEKDKLNISDNILKRCVFDCERAVISHALARAKGNLSAAARLLGTTKRILSYKVHKYGINFEQFRYEG